MYYIQLNSQVIAYEKTGEGRPVILIHGNGEDHKVFNELKEILRDNYTVVAVDSRGHGESAMPKEYHYKDMANDMVALIDSLNLVKPIVVGFSDGGIVGLLMAIEHSDILGGLITCGANLTPSGLKWKESWKMKKAYRKDKNPLTYMMMTEPNITEKDLEKISVLTFVMAGEDDAIKEEETRNISAHIADSRLYILEGETHGSYVTHETKLKKYIDDLEALID